MKFLGEKMLRNFYNLDSFMEVNFMKNELFLMLIKYDMRLFYEIKVSFG